jgi:hypothetical protein
MSEIDFSKLKQVCAWKGCTEMCDLDNLPDDWRWVLVYWSPFPETDRTMGDIAFSPDCERDCALCGKHSQQLDTMLEGLG